MMTKNLFNCLFLFILGVCSQAGHLSVAASTHDAPSVKTYVNERIGFSLEYPDLFQSYGFLDDGIVYCSTDGHYRLWIECRANEEQMDGDALLELRQAQVTHIEHDSEKSGPNFYAMRHGNHGAYKGYGRTDYEYGFVTKDLIITFTFRYPDDQDETGLDYVGLGDRIAASIKLLDPVALGAEKPSFYVKDKAVYYGTKRLQEAKLTSVEKGALGYWSAINEENPGAYLFDKEGRHVLFLALASAAECQDLIFSDDGALVALVREDASSPICVTYEVYEILNLEGLYAFKGIRDEFQWLDERHFVATLLEDGIRKGGAFRGVLDGLRLSVICMDAYSDDYDWEYLKKATDTQNFSLKKIDAKAKKVFITEEYVKKVKDWTDKGKIQSKEITIPYPMSDL